MKIELLLNQDEATGLKARARELFNDPSLGVAQACYVVVKMLLSGDLVLNEKSPKVKTKAPVEKDKE